MTDDSIRETIINLFRKRELLKDVSEDEEFFELGVSSLTVIDLQVAVEGALNVSLPTSELMRLSTMREWIEIYTRTAFDAAAAP